MKVASPTGRLGEQLAVQYLQKHSYKIIKTNFSGRYGEIDIIAIDRSEKESVLVFIEVKTRKSSQYGTPLEAITFFKLQSLTKTAQFYKLYHSRLPEQLRIDAVSVVLNPDNSVDTIELMKNISG